MKIALISYWSCPLTKIGLYKTGGMSIYLRQQANYLAGCGHEVDIFTRAHSKIDRDIFRLKENIRIIHLGKRHNLDLYRDVCLFSNLFLRFIKKERENYDMLHAHYFLSGLVGLNLKKSLLSPLVITFHTLGVIKKMYLGEEDKRRIDSEEKIISQANAIIASTTLEKTDLRRFYKADERKIYTISPGVDHKVFKPKDKTKSRLRLRLPLDKKIILFVGRIDPVKGLLFLIKAVSILSRRYKMKDKDFRVILIGGDFRENSKRNMEEKRIKKIIEEEKLESCIKFIGSRPHSMLPYYYSAADVVVMPSVYESFGLVVLEAMACGAAVVVSKVGGLKYLVKDRFNGRSFKRADMENLACILFQLITDEEQVEMLGERAVFTSQKFCWRDQVLKLEKVYRRLL